MSSAHPWFKHSYISEIYIYQTSLLIFVVVSFFLYFRDDLSFVSCSFSFLFFPLLPCWAPDEEDSYYTVLCQHALAPRGPKASAGALLTGLPFVYPDQSTHMQERGLFSFPIIRERWRGKIKEVLKSFDIDFYYWQRLSFGEIEISTSLFQNGLNYLIGGK